MQALMVRGLNISIGLFLAVAANIAQAGNPVNVTQYHNDSSRDGLYIDPAFTFAAASNLTRDLNFNGTVSGNVYAQPLYIEGGPNGRAMIIAVTESNNVYALDAAGGNVLWQDHVGAPVPQADMPCGNIDPVGITGTPVVDLASRTLFFDAMTTPDGGTTKRHLIFAVNVDTGAVLTNWPVDVNATARSGTNIFDSTYQGERGGLAFVNNIVYAPYGGFYGDCGPYHGWIVGVPAGNPTNVMAWATPAQGGGAWGVSGVASDGTNLYIGTGNTFNVTTWGGGDAVIRFAPGPLFSGSTNNYWAPTNWYSLDESDQDLGSSGAMLVNVPGATPSALAVALGKDGNAYLLNRTNLSGVNAPVAQAHVSSSVMIQASAAYQTAQGTYVAYRASSSQLAAFSITATNPPGIVPAWSVSQSGRGSPFVTSTGGTNNVIVWAIGSEGDQKLHGYNGQTGAVIFGGGGANELMDNTRRFSTGIVARGRIYIANDDQVYAFTVPVPPIMLTNLTLFPNGSFEFGFTNTPGLSFSVYTTTNLSLPFANWTLAGPATELSPGQFQFTESYPSDQQCFYRITSP